MFSVRRSACSAIASLSLVGATALLGIPASASADTVDCGSVSTGSPAGPAFGSPAGPAFGSLSRPDLGSQSAKTENSPYLCAETGDIVDVRIGDVRATQPSVGYDQVYYKLGRYSLGKDSINKKFDDWCEANGQGEAKSASATATLTDPSTFTCKIAVGKETASSKAEMKTVVVGPRGALYLTDGHHTLTSFYETSGGGANVPLRLRVVGNLSSLSESRFWTEMAANKWVWTRDAENNPVIPQTLPKNLALAGFQDDKYRSLAYFSRDIGFSSTGIAFQEFYWGAWIRDSSSVDLHSWNTGDFASYLDTVKAVTKAQTLLPGSAVVNGNSTAKDLGVLSSWNDGKSESKGEFAKLSTPYSDSKPGKLAYALAYKATL
ncbi:hypothetical protein ABH922_000043 [Rhodococcus sp. 27YEA15]|uniref:ParB/Srx family N-terminal domain-containing protein n=1 Tax=Rhodococcus sp. 27YEA15 TaxID=3156259 RepID=UPI003C7B16E9